MPSYEPPYERCMPVRSYDNALIRLNDYPFAVNEEQKVYYCYSLFVEYLNL